MSMLDGRQESKLNMYHTVRATGEANPTIVSTNKAFSNAFNEFKTIIPLIEDVAQRAGKVITGIAAGKKVTEEDLSKLAARAGGQIYAYADKIGDEPLKESVNFSASDLLHMRDGEIALQAQNIHDAGVENLAALDDYGITTEKLAELQIAIDSHTGKVSDPREAIVERRAAKAALKPHFAKADRILKRQLDKLIEDLAEEHPDFVNQYKSARVIVDPPSKARKPKTPPA